MMNLLRPSASVVNDNTAKCVPVLFLCRRTDADVGKRVRETGQHLIKKFLKPQVTGRVIKTAEKRRMVRKCVVVRYFLFLLFNPLAASKRWASSADGENRCKRRQIGQQTLRDFTHSPVNSRSEFSVTWEERWQAKLLNYSSPTIVLISVIIHIKPVCHIGARTCSFTNCSLIMMNRCNK